MRPIELAILFVFLSFASFAQKVVINGSEGKRNLEWTDFTGVPDSASKFSAHTYWNLRYKFSRVAVKGDIAKFKKLSAELQLNPERTWYRKGRESDRLLQHEQGHFDIGHLAMLDFLQEVKRTTFYKVDYRQKLQKLFNATLAKHREMGKKYDEETQHYRNIEKQKEWNSFIRSELERLAIK